MSGRRCRSTLRQEQKKAANLSTGLEASGLVAASLSPSLAPWKPSLRQYA